jgi:PPOX class probable FMN-dependent enzyme
MAPNPDHVLSTVDQVRAIVGEESAAVRVKLFSELEPTSIGFIRQSPFLLLSTANAQGQPDVSPKGDGPGFVVVEDEHTLLIPEQKGNKLIFSLQNILANPRVGLLFMVPGTEETLRVHGTAELTRDPAILERLTQRGKPALLAIRVRVESCFFHCAKAFKRSQLWKTETWPENLRLSFGKLLAPKFGGGEDLEKQIDVMIAEDYKTGL